MRLRDTLLIMSEDNSSRADLREIFENTYNILEAVNREQLLSLLEQNESCIAALILDIPPTPTRETSITYTITSNPSYKEIPVIIIMPRNDIENELRAYEYGASDAISKPYIHQVVYRRLQAIVELFAHKSSLEVLVDEQAEILRRSHEVMVDALSSIIEYRSAESGRHVQRIRYFAKLLLEDIAANYPEYQLTPEDIQSIVSATTLHDIGKISIPDYILNKPGKLTSAEFEIMKNHTVNGAHIIEELAGIADQKYLRYAYNIALYHHERWDGSGYPKGLRGDEIPICAQVASLADVYDALTTDRVYKEKYPHTQAVNMILNKECGVFPPKLLECFKNVKTQFAELSEALADNVTSVSEDFTEPLPGPNQNVQRTDTLQLVQMKYQALLHYIDATVLEADLNTGSYHIVFNPNVHFSFLTGGTSFEDAVREMIASIIHPDDRYQTLRFFVKCRHAFYEQGLRKYSCQSRIYHPAAGEYGLYEFTLLQIGNETVSPGRIMLLLYPVSGAKTSMQHMPEPDVDDMLYGLAGSVICCRNDKAFTILEGAENLFSLIGYTKNEIETQFDNSLVKLVIPEDREFLIRQLTEQLPHGDFVEIEYRLQKKYGSPVWILDKSRLTTGPDGMERFYSVLNNNTRARTSQEQLQLLLERNEIIMNQTDDIIFEWDIVKDYLTCSSKWQQRFGYELVPEKFSKNVHRISCFHPDDLKMLSYGLKKLKSGGSYAEMECRIINSSGRYTWNRIRATLQRDKEGRPARAIGVIVDIDSSKRVAQSLQEKAERDSLTGLFNREASQKKISSALMKHDEKLMSALLMIDLDNFKTVNDTYGHLFGDVVLTRTAEEIRKLFRNNDIISRIGGDEFMVFINAIPDANLVKSRCNLLVENLRSMFAEMVPGAFISCSIGAALYPEHGMSYLDLYQRADQALYYTKNQGKNSYVIYDENITLIPMGLSSTINARIDSDELPSINSNSLVQTVFHHLYNSRDLQETLPLVLGEVGRAMNVSRVYIFENNDTNTACSNTFEWCNEGILPEIENLQDMSYLRGPVQGWDQNYAHSDVFYCADVSKLPDSFRLVLEAQSVKSLLQCAIRDNGQFRGFIGFDECSSTRMWTQDQIDLLIFLSQTVSMFLLQKRSQEKNALLSSNLQNILDSLNAFIYVIDPETARIQYANRKTKELSPRVEEGARCYEVLQTRSKRCDLCPVMNLGGSQKCFVTLFNQLLSQEVRCEVTQIQWNGKDARLVTCSLAEN